MSIALQAIVLTASGILAAYLDVELGVKPPWIYWFIGSVGATFASVVFHLANN